MGALDSLIGQVLGGALGGQSNNPLGSVLGGLAGNLGGPKNVGASGGLGGMLGSALGGAGGARSTGGALAGGAILAAMLQMLQQGGIGAVLGKLQSSGLGAHAASWTGTGANMPVTGDQLHQALGADALGGMAAKLGITTQQASGVLSQVLPELVNQLSPSGQLPANHQDLLSEGLEMLRGLGHH
jgi:uncharacterized protein YidB (DUF937 family)